MSSVLLPELPNHPHLTPQELAAYLRVSVRVIYRLIAEKELPYLRWSESSVIRIPHAQFLEWYDRHRKRIV